MIFPAPRLRDGTLDFSIALALPAAVATHAASSKDSRVNANINSVVRGGDAFNRPSNTGDVPDQPHLLLLHVQTVTIALISRHLLESMLAPQALVVLARMARHALFAAIQVAEGHTAATASSALYDHKN